MVQLVCLSTRHTTTTKPPIEALYPDGEYPVSAGLPAIAAPWFGSHNDYRFPLCCILTSKLHKVRLYDVSSKRIVIVKPKVKPAEGQRTRSLIPGMLGHPALHPSVGMHIPFLINSSALSDLAPRAEQALLGKLMSSTLNARLDLANPEVQAYVDSVEGDLAPLYYRYVGCACRADAQRQDIVRCVRVKRPGRGQNMPVHQLCPRGDHAEGDGSRSLLPLVRRGRRAMPFLLHPGRQGGRRRRAVRAPHCQGARAAGHGFWDGRRSHAGVGVVG